MTLQRGKFASKAVAILALLTLVAAACSAPPPPGGTGYKSTALAPPVMDVVSGPGATGDGLLFTSINGTPPGVPRGFTIYDETGEPVWHRPNQPNLPMTADLKVVDWGGGQQALAMYEGELFPGQLGVSTGTVTVLDTNYDEIGVFGPQYDPQADLHDFLVTDSSFFYLIYDPVTMDLSSYGGPTAATVFDAVIQEVDRATGAVAWEWHSLDHISIEDTNRPLTLGLVDYLHVNSMELDAAGNVLISARTADALYMIDKTTGSVSWKLGGTNGTPSDFTFPDDPANGFLFQHDARILPDGTIGLFDNGGNGIREWSRGVRYALDFGTMEASMVQELRTTPDTYGFAMGNVDWLPNGNALVGWGTGAGATEFDAAGNVVLDVDYPAYQSYRTRRFEWVGTPSAPPDAIVWPGEAGATDIFMSWNGSTETAQWRIEGGTPGNLTELATVPRDGFETQVSLNTTECDFAITPLDSSGNPLAPPLEKSWAFPWTCPA